MVLELRLELVLGLVPGLVLGLVLGLVVTNLTKLRTKLANLTTLGPYYALQLLHYSHQEMQNPHWCHKSVKGDVLATY